MNESNEQKEAEVLYQTAMDLFDQQRFGECLSLLRRALALDTENAHIYYEQGNALYEMKRYRDAAASYLWALRRDPYFVSAMTNLGNAYCFLKMCSKSLKLYERAAQLDPDNGYILYNYANALAEIGLLQEAVEAYSLSIQLMPAFDGNYLNRANTLSRLMKHQEALADYQQALALTPGDSNIAWTVCWAHFGSEPLTDQVVQELERISRLDPKHYTSQMCLGVIALSREATQESLFHLEQAVTAEPEQWDPHFWIGLVAALTGETEIARQAIERSLELGLPPLLLTPLYWLKSLRPDFFELHAVGLLQRSGL